MITYAKNSFIHIDEPEIDDMPQKCVSNVLDGLLTGWQEDENKSEHVEGIISSYRRRSSASSEDDLETIQAEFSPQSSNSEDHEEHDFPDSPRSPVAETPPLTPRQTPQFTAGEWSVGAEWHEAGICKPCAWYHKPAGCSKGASCEFCHVCDSGAVKRKKKVIQQKTRDFQRNASLRWGEDYWVGPTF
jgi:hypothetical protein